MKTFQEALARFRNDLKSLNVEHKKIVIKLNTDDFNKVLNDYEQARVFVGLGYPENRMDVIKVFGNIEIVEESHSARLETFEKLNKYQDSAVFETSW